MPTNNKKKTTLRNKTSTKRPFPEVIIFIILFLLNTLSAFIFNLNEIWQMMPIRFGATFINGVGVSLLTIICLHYIHKYLHINLTPVVIGITWLVFILEIFLLFNFYTLITPSCIMVLLETNQQESSEFMMAYFNNSILYFIIIIILIVSIALYYFRNNIKLIPFPAWLHQNKYLIPCSISILIVYAGLTYYVTQVRQMTSYQALTGIERIYHSTQKTIKDRREYHKYMKLIQHAPPVITENQSTVPYIVIILGESLSKRHLSAYEYPLPTTPRLNDRINDKETYRFDSITAAKTITSESIRRIMTFFEDSSIKPWYQYYTLPEVMNAANYRTYWLSNQDSFNVGDENSTAGIASTCSVVKFTHPRHASEERYGYFDGDLLPLLDKELNTLPEKAFFCLHLMGSHRRYTNRYPAEFSKFKIKDIKKNISKEKKRTISEYDNSILYNDYVTDEIINRFSDKDAIIFYFPDHGEEVYDTRNMSGHGLTAPTDPMCNIPLLVWTSKLFKQNHSDIEKRIQSNTKRQFNTENIIHTIMDVSNIKTSDYHQEKSLFCSY